jgi:hypothetical protein
MMLATQVVAALIGAAALARGGYLFLTAVPSHQWVPSLIWLGAGIVVHDVVIAPVTLLLGRILKPSNALRFGWLAAGTAVLLSIPLIQGAQVRRNPTVIPDQPWGSLLISLALIAAGVLVSVAARRAIRRGRTATNAPET